MIDLAARLRVEKLGNRGEGVARNAAGLVFIPCALPGETVLAEVDGDRGKLIEVLEPSSDRIAAICGYFGVCGGCAVQNLRPRAYADWKRGLVVEALVNAGVSTDVASLIAAHGEGRRRATFHARNDQRGDPHVGFMQARAHRIVEIDACPLLAPQLAGALDAARTLARELAHLGKPLDIVVTGGESGLDIDLHGVGPLEFADVQKLTQAAERLDLARLSNHGATVVERRPPIVTIGRAEVAPPPGGFLQATRAGETVLTDVVAQAAAGAKGSPIFSPAPALFRCAWPKHRRSAPSRAMRRRWLQV